MPVSDGWVQVVRRPNHRQFVGPWRNARRQPFLQVLQFRRHVTPQRVVSSPPQTTRSAISRQHWECRVPKIPRSKRRLQAALKRAKEDAGTKPVQSVRLNQDAAMSAARTKRSDSKRRWRRSRARRVEARTLSGQSGSQELPSTSRSRNARRSSSAARNVPQWRPSVWPRRSCRQKVVHRCLVWKRHQLTPVDVNMVATDTGVELVRLRAQVAELQGSVVTERPRVRQRVGCVGVVPMPTLVPAELGRSGWTTDKPIFKKPWCLRQCASACVDDPSCPKLPSACAR